jgi:hypothetical protein
MPAQRFGCSQSAVTAARAAEEEALFSEGGDDGEGFGSHGHPKVHSKHLSKIEAKVSADREANASF